MAKKLPLTLACGDYEIVRALKENGVEPDGIELTVLTRMDSTTRHWRFLRNGEFDIAECSASSYITARDHGRPFAALPVFLHRRFRHGFIFINTRKGITKPTDLIGRRIGVKTFQQTAANWCRGILEHEYGVPHKSIEWVTERDEDIDFEPAAGLRLTKIADHQSLDTMLAEGEIDAVMSGAFIRPFLDGDPNVGRLFPNYKEEEQAYYRNTGIFPIMHVVGIRQEIVDKHPWVPINLYRAFDEAKAIAMKRLVNPRIVPLAWYRSAWEEQEAILGKDPWEYGLSERNQRNLNTLTRYSHEQGLTRTLHQAVDLFEPVSQGRRRGGESI
ncbi:MAG: ABC transporter substrate-binding protein [Hyphomicrobiales bacterium]|nr:ABC transporter substrate-binding protein [Hyphomicrobiales bacterium]